MKNADIFKEYSSEQWVIEQNLCYMLQTYWDEHCVPMIWQAESGYKVGKSMPMNPVSFVKKFMKEETLCDTKYAEKSKIDTLQSGDVIEGVYELPPP